MKKKLDKRFLIAYLVFRVFDILKRFTARPTAAAAAHHAWRRIGIPPGKRFGGRAREGGGLPVCVETPPKAKNILFSPSAFEVFRIHTDSDQRF